MILPLLLAALAAYAAPKGLTAAAGKIDITPDPGASTVWLAGYGATGRKADGVHRPLYARALVLDDGDETVAIVSVDAISLFREDVVAWRRALGWAEGKRYLFVTATHSHSAPDLAGLWGRLPGVSGVDPAYRRRVLNSVVAMIRELEGKRYPVEVLAARTELRPDGLCTDDRDPAVLDTELNVIHLRLKGKAKPLATLIRWSCHPVILTEANTRVSSDFPGPLCDRVESSGGGACVFLPGALGGHLLPPTDRKAPVAKQYDEVERVGGRVADEALRLLKRLEPAGGGVSFSSAVVRVPVENSRYLAFLPSLAFGHRLFDAGGRELPGWRRYWLPLKHVVRFPLSEEDRPWVETEVSRIDLGKVRLLGVPGEIFPELVVGGYDGSRRYGQPLVGPANPNPPDLAKAPKGPYLRERLGRHGVVVGLANDELGYIVPEYDFQATPTRTMLPKPPGTHYEETNSIGRRATPILLSALEALLRR